MCLRVGAPLQGKQVLSICGPDATKIGVDFNVTLAVLSDPQTGLSFTCPPQVDGRLNLRRVLSLKGALACVSSLRLSILAELSPRP